jgi:hypothetical protein
VSAPTGTRQVRIRSEYAPWYPTISVAVWLPAQLVARKVARQLMEGEPPWAPRWAVGPRLLDEQHFTFRRGVERGARGRTRLGDARQDDSGEALSTESPLEEPAQ